MDAPVQISRPRASAEKWVALGISLLFALLIRVPWVPSLFEFCTPRTQFSGSRQLIQFGLVDGSYVMALHELAIRHADFSKYPFTFGPWGFLYHGYHPGTYTTQIIAWLFLATVFWWTCVAIIRTAFGNPWIQAVLVCVLAIMTWRGYELDVSFYSFFVLLIVHYFHVDRKGKDWTGLVLTIAISLISLVKFSFCLTAMPIILLIALDESLRLRRWPRYLVTFVGATAFFWLLARQPPLAFFKYLQNSWEVSSYFQDAMAYSHPAGETNWWTTVNPLPFMIVAAAILAVSGWISARRNPVLGAAGAISLACLFFVCLKSSFMGYDPFHALHASTVALFAAMVLAICLWKIDSTRVRKSVALVLVLMSLGLISHDLNFVALAIKTKPNEPRQSRDLFSEVAVCLDSVPSSLENAAAWLTGQRPAAKEFRKQIAPLRRQALPHDVSGTFDLYPTDSLLLLANHLNYQPRPALQSYCAYSPNLAELDAAYLRSADAPEYILFDLRALPKRFPSIEDGRSWPELLTRYDIQADLPDPASGNSAGYLLLHKAAQPRDYELKEISQITTGFRQPVTVPSASDRAIWVEIDIRNSLRGKMMATAYKTPPVWLSALVRVNGKYVDRRLPMGMAKAGFLLSPLIHTREAFADFARPDWSTRLGQMTVERLQFSAGDNAEDERYFDPQISIRFYSFDLTRRPE